MSSGKEHSCALRADGTAACWGSNIWGQCNVPSGHQFVQISAGAWHHTCGVDVTGAGGGVGSIAVAVLSYLGFEVVASTRRSEIHEYLSSLGASSIISSDTFDSVSRPLMPEQWIGVIDTVGGNILGALIPSVKYWGCIASCGNAGGINFSSNVLPFILRGIKLQGVESVYASIEQRKVAWDRLADNLSKPKLNEVTNIVNISEAFDVAKQILDGNVRGRTVVDVNNY